VLHLPRLAAIGRRRNGAEFADRPAVLLVVEKDAV
jgi:hypothetical protein